MPHLAPIPYHIPEIPYLKIIHARISSLTSTIKAHKLKLYSLHAQKDTLLKESVKVQKQLFESRVKKIPMHVSSKTPIKILANKTSSQTNTSPEDIIKHLTKSEREALVARLSITLQDKETPINIQA